MTPTLPARPSSAQFEFDWKFRHNYPLLTLEEIMEDNLVSDQTIRNWVDGGRVMGFAINIEDTPQREHLRIVRASLETDLTCILPDTWRRVVATVDQWLFPHQRPVLLAHEICTALRCTKPHVRALYDAGQLRAASIGVGMDRKHLRIDRGSIVSFVRKRLQTKTGITQ